MSELATLGGGCFWCLDAFYRRVRGVEQVVSGYSGHTEVVQLSFDPKVITYRELLEIFFVMHDPTTLNRQGPDVGEEYRSVIFYHSPEQQKLANDLISNFVPTLYKDEVVTAVEAFEDFTPAEEYHQDFYNSGQRADYCTFVIDPKIQKLRQQFATKLKPLS